MNTTHPLVSLCIFTYNQEKFIEEALSGAVKQTYDNLEIIVSDDCSTDNTFSIIQKFVNAYSGPHKIIINRNEKNLRHREHFNRVIYNLVHGDIIAVGAGDDINLPDRVQETVDFFNANPQVISLHFESEQVDVNLNPLNKDLPLSHNMYSVITLDDYVNKWNSRSWLYSGDSRAFRKEVIKFFPPLEVSHNEDLPFFVRCLILGASAIIRKPLVLHRIHGNNESRVLRFKQEGKDLFNQLSKDIEYAYSGGKLNKKECIKLKMKISSIHRSMMMSDLRKILYLDKIEKSIKKYLKNFLLKNRT